MAVLHILAFEGGERNNSDAVITMEAGMWNFERKNTLALLQIVSHGALYCSYNLMRICPYPQAFLLRNLSYSISYRVLGQIAGCSC